MQSVCLCMIVKDEAAVLERSLSGVRKLIDSWVICDTGSSDGTPELVARLLSGVPGRLHRSEWRDFGYNRSELMKLARGGGDYLLLLDADMTITFDRTRAGGLSADAYLARHATSAEYWIPRLVRGDRAWRYMGRTHESLVVSDTDKIQKLDCLVIHHHVDGSSRAEKFDRDLNLLTEDLREDPENARTVFYLAQTHRDAGNSEVAIDLYDRRARMGGWDEEVFQARFQAALLRAERGDWPAAMTGLLAAWEFRPSRIEPLYELASRLRLRGDYQSAYQFARRGLGQPPPPDVLFVWSWVYRWGMLFEYSIAAYWVGNYEAARDACQGLLAMPDLPAVYRAHTLRNLEFCLQHVPHNSSPTPGPTRRRARRRRSR